MRSDHNWSPAERLLHHVQELERLEEERKAAAENVRDGFRRAGMDGFDPDTLKVVLKLRKLPAHAIAERRALEDTYLVALGMLSRGLSDEARQRLDEEQRRQRGEEPPPQQDKPAEQQEGDPPGTPPQSPATRAPQTEMQFKTAEEAYEEGRQAGREGQSLWSNPYKDPLREGELRGAWDRGWCHETKSNGMEPNKAWGRRTTDKKPDDPPDDAESSREAEREMEDA